MGVLDRNDVARLRGVTVDAIKKAMQRHPEGTPGGFPERDGTKNGGPVWNESRADELRTWKRRGRGIGGGRPRKTTTERLDPKHLAVLDRLVDMGRVEAGNSDHPSVVPYPTLKAMERRGLVTLRTRKYTVARITQHGLDERARAHGRHRPADDATGAASGTEQPAPITLSPLRPINRRATNDVFRNLQRPLDKRDPWGSAGEKFGFGDPELYRERAMDWLGEHSELSTRTIRSADWLEIFEYFRSRVEGAGTPETGAQAHADGTGDTSSTGQAVDAPAPASEQLAAESTRTVEPASEPEPVDPIGPRRLSDDPAHANMTSLWQVIAYENAVARKRWRQARADARKRVTGDPNAPDHANVRVDIVESGRAVVVGPGFRGYAGRDSGRKSRTYYVQVTDSDTRPNSVDKVIGNARTYAAAGELLAQHHGLTNYTVAVDPEK